MEKQYFAFQWHITDECDQRCKHCYIFAEGHPALVTMSWSQMQAVFRNALDFCRTFSRLPYFYITGGDPILHPHFWSLMEMLKEHGVPFTLMGNPFHLDDAVCRRLRDFGCDKYQMSIDGLERTHDWFRKPGSFRETLGKIQCINGAGMTSVIMSTVSGTNMDEMPGVVDAVVEAQADVYAFARYVPTSCGKAGAESGWYIPPERYRDFLEVMDKKYTGYERQGVRTYFNRKDHLWALFDYEHGRLPVPGRNEGDDPGSTLIHGGCNCGNCHLTILPDGSVYACRRVAGSAVGNAFTDRLAELWTSGRMESYREFGKFSRCASCRLLAYCRGCPAVASGSGSGDFYAPDPQCWRVVA